MKNHLEKKEKVIVTIILFVFVILAFGIITQIFIRIRAKNNAISYIEEKYGFTPEVLSIKKDYDIKFNFDIIISYSKTSTGKYQVEMQHDNKDFTVYIPRNKNSGVGTDDYQTEEIDSAIQTDVASYFDGKVLAVRNYHNNQMFHYYNVSDYYDGSNIKKFYPENASYYIYTVGCDLQTLDLNAILKNIHADSLYVFDCNSEEAFTDFFEQNPFDVLDPQIGGLSIDSFRPYLDECAILKADSEKEYLKINLREGDGFLYDTAHGGNVTFSKIENIDLENWNNESLVGTTSGYSVTSDEEILIYVPAPATPEKFKTLFYSYTNKDGTINYTFDIDTSINDHYYMFSIAEHELNNLEIAVTR